MRATQLVPLLLAGLSAVCSVQVDADSTHASVRPGDPIADARCVVVGINMATIRRATPQSAGIMIALYYSGRLDARSHKSDLEALVADEAAKMTMDELTSEAARCLAEFKDKGDQLTAIGQRLVEREKRQER